MDSPDVFGAKMEAAYDLIKQANIDMINLWVKDTLFTWKWWLGVMLSIVPWVLWFMFRKKNSTNRLLFIGFFVILISSWLDIVGLLFGLWSYYHNVVPFSPAFIPWDFTLLPIAIMSLLQYKPHIRPIYKALAFSTLSCFVVEPTFVLLGLYHLKHWHYIYSFPIIVAIYMAADWCSKRQHFAELSSSPNSI